MKKILSAVAAVGLAVAMTVSSFAYVASPEKSSENQIKLVSIKAVDVQTAISGVRSYSELTDTTRGYQVNDVIYLATTVEVRNLEKSEYRSLKSIEDKDVPTIVGSAYVDLSYSKYASPILLSHIYSGINDTTIGTFADVISVSSVLDYDKNKNEVKFKFRGYQQNAVTWLTGFNTSSYSNVYLSAYIMNDKIYVPALRAKDGSNTITLGNQTYKYSYDAPSSMAYTLVLTGVCKDNAGATSGDFYAKIEISGAEKFVDEGYYYVSKDGKQITGAQLATGGVYADYVEWVDYIKVNVKLLEIENAYNVYKYEIPSSAMLGTKVPVIYVGDDDDYDNKVLAKADPNSWDYSTGKTTKDGSTVMIDSTESDTAGGVTAIDAVYTYSYDSKTKTFTSSSKKSVPLTGVVYTELATVYAPAYYAGIVGATGNRSVLTAYGDTFTAASKNVTKDRTTVDYYELENVRFDGEIRYGGMRNLDVTVIDTYSNKLIMNNGGVSNGAVYDTLWSLTDTDNSTYWEYTVRVTPKSGTVYPVGTVQDSTSAQAWEVYLGTPVNYAAGTVGAIGAGDLVKPAAYQTAFNAVNALTGPGIWPTVTSTWTAGDGILIVGKQNTVTAPVSGAPVDTPAVKSNPGVATDRDGWETSTTDLFGKANMVSPIASGTFNQSATLRPYISNKNVAAVDSGIRITLKDDWDDTYQKEKAAGKAVNAGTSGYTVKNVYVYWATSNEAGFAAHNGVVVEQFDASKGQVEIDGSDIIVYPGKTQTGTWTTADVGDANAGTLSHAYIKGTDTILSGATGLTTGGGPSNLGAALPANPAMHPTAYGAGWAQTNNYYKSGYVSTGYANAMVVVEFEVPAGSYSYSTSGSLILADYVDVVNGDNANGYYGTGHNGIDVYVITYNSDDQPIVAVATESTYFESESGLSIAMFDAYNLDMIGTRISRSSNTNLVYATGAGNVASSSKIITAMKYFGLDTSWSTTYRIVQATFEAKGAQAVYSEEVKGTFNYGTLTLVGEEVEEGTDDVEVTDDEEEEVPDVDDEEEEEVVDNTTDDVPPATGDSSVNIAIALAAAAIVAAAGLVFVMKKAR